MNFDALVLLNPLLLGCLLTFLMLIALPPGFLPSLYNIAAIGYSFLLMSRGFIHISNGTNISSFDNMVVVDPLASYAAFFLGAVGLGIFLCAPRYLERNGWSKGEFYFLSLVSMTGMLVCASTRHFTGLFLGIETMTIPLYFLMSSDRDKGQGRSAALKYLALGGVGSALLLYGIALIYGQTGSLYFPTELPGGLNFGSLGAVFLVCGILFKVGAFPFHGWVPDVYGASPSPLTGFMATGVKVAAFAAFLRLISLLVTVDIIAELLPIVALITMSLGNLMALAAKNPKKVLAYSSIAHTGYLLIGFSGGGFLNQGILLYLAGYTLMTLGAFAVISAVPSDEDTLLKGLIHHRPAMAVGFSVCILSLAGIPPLVGFYGKLTLFAGAWAIEELRWLVIAGVINSLIALGYYIPMVRHALFQSKGSEHDMTSRSLRLELACALSAAAVIYWGLFPGHLMSIFDTVVLK